MERQTIAVIDYGMGNLRSVAKALEHVVPACRVSITADPAVIDAADRVVFPGQGAAQDCMRQLHAHDHLLAAVRRAFRNKPLLGICMGLQVLFEHSEENGGVECLGLIPGQVRAFAHDMRDAKSGERLAVPHTGWNQVWHDNSHPLWQGIAAGTRFYYCNSYYVLPTPADRELIVARSDYGHWFTAAVATEKTFACQFHPEKSAAAGLQLLRNFAAWTGNH